MIVRIWRGWTTTSDADAYHALLSHQIFPDLTAITGFLGAELLRAEIGAEVEFMVVTRFESFDGVRSFAGDDYEMAVVSPEARSLLTHFDVRCRHYVHAALQGR